jgi:CBS domain-containing protein
MKIASAFPRLKEKDYPIVEPDVSLLTVLFFLRMKDMDAVPITSGESSGHRAVLDRSSLDLLARLGPKAFSDLLKGPCERVADELPVVEADDEVESLLDAFVKRNLGLALVRQASPGKSSTSLITLIEFLDLYETGVISTGMTLGHISSPIFSLPGDTPLSTALQAMISRNYGPIFVEGVEDEEEEKTEKGYLSDRGLINHILSPSVLAELRTGAANEILSTPINKLKRSLPLKVPARIEIKDAAFKLGRERGRCLVSSDERVVTPWDIVIKPWKAGGLLVGERGSRISERALLRYP